jgi:excisionase family DNA binding protein
MSARTADDKVLYTPDEAAAFLNSNRRTLERWRTTGTGPRFVKVGRRVHYRREALLAFIEQQERSHTGDAA